MSEAVPRVSFEFPSDGVIHLGPANRSALKRLANIAQAMVDSGQPLPPSPLAEYIAQRLSSDDKQDYRALISGKIGAGKSYVALFLATRIAEALARERGGTPQDYFTLANCATLLDNQGINNILASSKMYQVIIIDDSQVSLNSRDFALRTSKNFLKVFSTMRTRRWCLLLTAPARSHVDLGIREMISTVIQIYASFHAGKFNVCKINSIELSENQKNKVYTRRLSFNKKKIDFWVAFAPDPKMAAEYDKIRDEAAQRIIQETAQNPTGKKAAGPTLAERNLIALVEKYSPIIQNEIKATPLITVSKIADKTGLNRANVRRIAAYANIPLKGVD